MKKRFWVLPLPEIFSASDNRARVEGGAGGALAPPPPPPPLFYSKKKNNKSLSK